MVESAQKILGWVLDRTWTLLIAMLSKAFIFTGRTSRSDYWLFQLLVGLLSVVPVLIDVKLHLSNVWMMPGPFSFVFVLVFLIPSISAAVRRLHDTDISGWVVVASLVPTAGPPVLLFFLLFPGDEGSNPYGEDPYADDNESDNSVSPPQA